MIKLNDITKLAGATALALAVPAMASASVVPMTINNDAPYSLDDYSAVYRWDTEDEFEDTNTSGQEYYFKFSASDLPQGTFSTITVNTLGDFEDLKIAWSANQSLDSDDTYIPLSGSVDFSFAVPDSTYYLVTSYTGRSNGGNLDYRISAVPVPAAGGLLLLALGGLGVARKRRKAA
ncbi:VPLPA-CTERM sorting domain-containing protein [Aquicoccus sp. SCR17]|nr:VPLPA-CTERM sorting domain-containing protein [Carideicomes alvinocaridis]